jgi:DNA-binding HxlR family transcriptional regulator
MEYGQFCPIAKATEIIGEKWTVLIIRELIMGGSRFNELHRGLSLISPTILSKRLDSLVEHGLVVARSNLDEKDYDVELLMLYLKRSIVTDKLIGKETVIRFHFTDIDEYPDWWLVITGDELDLCVNDPGKDIDVYFTSSVKTMADIWMGDNTYRKALNDGSLKLVGEKVLTRNVTAWMSNSVFSDLPAASEI